VKFSIVEHEGTARCLKIVAENRDEVREIIDHYKLDPFQYTPEYEVGEMTHVCRPSKRDNAAWFALSTSLSSEWSNPYLYVLERFTGYTLTAEDKIPLRPYGYSGRRICHTHIEETVCMDSKGIHAQGFVDCGDWNGRTAAERAPGVYRRSVEDCFGENVAEPKYVRVGPYRRKNPNYGRWSAVPKAHSWSTMEDIFNWWLANKATPGQKAIWEKADACYRSVCRSSFAASTVRHYDRGIRVAWDGEGSVVSFEDFQKA
jgi:hypothetical protein